MPRKEQGYSGVSIKTTLSSEVEEFIKTHPTYRSVADFVSESVRLRLEQLRAKGVCV